MANEANLVNFPSFSVTRSTFKNFISTSVSVDYGRVNVENSDFTSTSGLTSSSQALYLTNCPIFSAKGSLFKGQTKLGSVFLKTDENRLSLVSIYNCSFQNHSTENNGAGIRAEGFSSIKLENCYFSKCRASQSGGAVYFLSKNYESILSLKNCSFKDNSAEG